MPPDTARTQQAALERVQRLQAKEDKARKRYEQDKSKSDSTLKQLAAKAAKDGAAKKKLEEVNGGKGDRKDGTPASGPVQGGKGMGPHKKNPVGDKSSKEAAKWSTKLAAASKKSQLPPDVPGANDAPQVATDGGKGAEEGGGGAAAGAGGGGGGAAGAAAGGGGAGGAGSTQKAKELTNAPPSEYAVKISETGKKITDEAKTEVSTKNEAMPTFSAKMSGGDANDKKGEKLNGLDKSVGDGKAGDDAAAPNLKKEKRIRTGKGKPGSDIKGAGGDAGADALKSLFSASLNKIDSKSSTNTSPGPSPTVQFGGASDPMRGNRAQEDANKKTDDAYVQAVQAVDAGPGPEQVQPLELQEDIPAANAELPPIPDVPTPAQAQEYIDKGHASDVYDKADELQKTNFDEALAEAESQFEQAGDNLETDHAAKVEEASKAVDEENKKAQEQQEAEVKKARADIDQGQKDTKKKQEKELVKAKRKGDKEKKSAQQKIEKRRKDDDKKINKKYKEAEKKAESKKKAAEKKAEAKKKAAEKKKSDESWWSRAASAVGSFIDSVANAVTGIFDAMAKAVGDILNKVKDMATSMIDAAISFATSALDALGDVLKGLVDGLLGDIFPGLASALNDLIDSAVNLAKDAVNAVGEKLKAAVTAAIDALNSGIQAAINTFKAAVSTALAIASAIASGDWEAAFKAMLEGALSLAGINPSEFYGLVGEGMDTINAIIDDPMSFVGNMISAVGNGFSQFADNFGSHLLNGAVEWLTGSLGEAGITLPETWDAAGIFGMIADILGVSWDKLKDKIGERIGEDNVAMLESIWGYVEAAMNGGIAGLWDHAKDQLGDLWSGLLDSAISMLTEQVITAAIMKIATMWNPAGAIVQAIITVWNVYNFVQEQAERIMGLVTSVVDSMSNIVQGQLSQASNFIENSLGDLVPVAISLLANLLGLGGISKKVKAIIEKIQEQVDKAIDWVLDKLFELGKAAFDALKNTMGGSGNEDPAAEQNAAEEQAQPEGGDPAQLPKTTLLSTSGNMDLGWDAQRGGQGASAKLTGGPFAGKVAAEAIGKMQTEAGKMEGPGKAEADSYISTARTQVLAVDSRGGKYIRGEELDLAPIRESFDLLARALLGGANAIGDETGGDKASSEADHGQMADAVEGAMGRPVTGSLTYEQWFQQLQSRATQQEQSNQGDLEPDVQIDVSMAANVNVALSAGEFAIDVTIAPNDTTGSTNMQLGSVDFDPNATLAHAGLEKDKVKQVYEGIGATLGLTGTEVNAALEDIWVEAMKRLNAQFPQLDANKVRGDSHRSGRVDLESKASKQLIDDLQPIADQLNSWMQQQETLFKSGSSWAFWSGYPAKDIAEANADVTLEKSALGAIFEGYNKPLSLNYPELWSAVSRAYVRRAAQDFENRTFRAFAGNIQDRSVWNQVEQPLFQHLVESARATPNITFYACAGIPTGNGRFSKDLSKSKDGVTGVFASGSGLAARDSIQTLARNFFEAISVGRDPELAEIEDPLKEKKDTLKNRIEMIKAGDATTEGWADAVRWAAESYVELCGDANTLVSHTTTQRELNQVPWEATKKLRDVNFEGITDVGALRSKATTYKALVTKWRGLNALLTQCNDRHAGEFSGWVDTIERSTDTALLALEISDYSDRGNRAWFAEKLPTVYTKRQECFSTHRRHLSDAFKPIWEALFTGAAAAVQAREDYRSLAPGLAQNTDNLWDRPGPGKVEAIKAERVGWVGLAGYTSLRERDVRARFNEIEARMQESDAVLVVQTEFDPFFQSLPNDVREADLARKEEVRGALVTAMNNQFSGWSRMVSSLLQDLGGSYRTRGQILTKIREYVSTFLAGFGDASPGGLTQLPAHLAEQVYEQLKPEDAENPLEANEQNKKWLVPTTAAGRLGGIWTGFALGVPFVGPALAGLGRFFASWGSKNNLLRAVIDAASEWAILQGVQSLLGLVAPVAGPIVGLIGATMASLGFVGGRTTRALVAPGEDTVTRLEGFKTRITDQRYSTPSVIARILDYLAQPDPDKA